MAYNPLQSPQSFVVINGRATPGIATVVGLGSPRAWDERQGYGYSGAFPVFRGRKLAKFKIKIRLYEDADWRDWDAFKDLVIKAPFGQRPKALSVSHPWCDMMSVAAMQVTDCSQPEPIEDGSAYEITIDCLEFRKPKIVLVKPEAAAPPVPTDPWDQKIQDNTAKIDALSSPTQVENMSHL